MQLSRLLGIAVVDAGHHPLGTVVDIRLSVPGDRQGRPEVLGLVVSPRTGSSFLGYDRTGTNAPVLACRPFPCAGRMTPRAHRAPLCLRGGRITRSGRSVAMGVAARGPAHRHGDEPPQ